MFVERICKGFRIISYLAWSRIQFGFLLSAIMEGIPRWESHADDTPNPTIGSENVDYCDGEE
jgi:hypothetical protein